MKRHLLPYILIAFLGSAAFGREVRGTVRDSTGAAIVGAQIEITGPHFDSTLKTHSDGSFLFTGVPDATVRMRVRAAGFAETAIDVQAVAHEVAVTLSPESSVQSVVVAATRTELPEEAVPADVRVISRGEIENSAGELTDDVLRQALGFSLFRRSDARVANPTSQGVALRGVGDSGASRAVVIRDGVPLNDPFGGWVQWARVPKLSLADVELVRGGLSDLYGANALSGVVDLVPARPATPMLEAELAGGNSTQPDFSLLGGGTFRGWQSSAAVETFHTPGYIPVPAGQRGSVDRPLALDFSSGDIFLSHNAGKQGRVFVEPSVFYEDRDNGTALQINRTELGQFVLGGDAASESWGTFSARAYATAERYHQSFSAIALDRNSESLTRFQIVPALATGTSLQWDKRLGRVHHLVGGFEWLRTRGHTEETAFVSGAPTSIIDAGGTMNNLGVFLEDYVRLGGRVLLSTALRGDRWNNGDGSAATTPLAKPVTKTTFFPMRDESAVSPRLALRYQATDRVAFTASAYRSFRPPTLNELYRSFRLGNVLTLANPALNAEHLTGGEAGAEWHIASPVLLRAVFFWAQVDDPVANTTLSVTPALITRQRTNLGATRARGTEFEAAWRWHELVMRGGYQWTDATVISNSRQPALVGSQVPQVPASQWTFSSEYLRGGWSLGLQARGAGVQFEDDQNLLPLDRYGTADVRVGRRLARQITAFVALENLFDQQVMIGRTPQPTFGPPFMVTGGVRLRLGPR